MFLLTEGPGGAVLHTAQGVIEKSAFPVTNVKDTIGAGDAFHSAFLAYLCRSGVIREQLAGPDLEALGNAVDFACAAAAINVSRVGCSPPTRHEVSKFIESTIALRSSR